ncbi:hypothetical protein [Jannaschia sp. R86511]|uniref:hypothetical protein n=1 Tax=Jannaschia sp. R86511 TaxID=3093853 RepID=UPI0036D37291
MSEPVTFAEAAKVTLADIIWSGQREAQLAYMRGHLDVLDVLGIDTNPTPDPAWWTDWLAEQRRAAEAARDYSNKPAPKTAAQIHAEVAHSWKVAQREIDERHGGGE